MLAIPEDRELGLAVVQGHDVVVAAGAGTAAPFGAGMSDEAAVLGDIADQFDRLFPLFGGDVGEIVVREREDIEAVTSRP